MRTILVVEDSSTNRRILSYTLQQAGYAVVLAHDGQEALAMLPSTTCDLIISDIAMPEMDGLELLKQVRADRIRQGLPFVMLTASGQDDDRMQARAAGASEFLTKPVSSQELIATVRRYLV